VIINFSKTTLLHGVSYIACLFRYVDRLLRNTWHWGRDPCGVVDWSMWMCGWPTL